MKQGKWTLTDLALIAMGGVLGAALRHAIVGGITGSSGLPDHAGWFNYAPNSSVAYIERGVPWRLLLANALGALLLGVFLAAAKRSTTAGLTRALRAGATGFCGSLTTFSTLAVELASRVPGGSTTSVTVGTNIEGFTPVEPESAVVYLTRSPAAVGELAAIVAISLVSGGLAFLLGRLVVDRLLSADSSPSEPTNRSSQ